MGNDLKFNTRQIYRIFQKLGLFQLGVLFSKSINIPKTKLIPEISVVSYN